MYEDEMNYECLTKSKMCFMNKIIDNKVIATSGL